MKLKNLKPEKEFGIRNSEFGINEKKECKTSGIWNNVFKYFEEISKIPRGSGNEKAISDYLANTARKKNLKVVQDEYYNIIIYKPGTKGYENHPAVILQGHMDMVCEKNTGTSHDFLNEALKLYIEGDYIKAEGTTLGADDGVALAYMLAILDEPDICHPPLEMLVTSDEETGMGGAENLDAGLLSGRLMVNMDIFNEDTIVSGCVGGVVAVLNKTPIWEEAADDLIYLKIEIKGLRGGHSGEEIDKERGNSLRLLARLLHKISCLANIRIADAQGGMKVNAIPRESSALIGYKNEEAEALIKALDDFSKETAMEYRVFDPYLSISYRICEKPVKYLSLECGKSLINALLILPHGILHMSGDIEGLPDTSCNMGVLEIKEKEILIQCMPRGFFASRIDFVMGQIETIGDILGYRSTFLRRYGAWQFNPDSWLRKTAAEVYVKCFGKQPLINAVHAGLECGIFAGKINGLDIISFGPTAHDLHNPDECLSISSTNRVWGFLLELLKKL